MIIAYRNEDYILWNARFFYSAMVSSVIYDHAFYGCGSYSLCYRFKSPV
jgi:hypothetical protein